jgi:hypothetical protein
MVYMERQISITVSTPHVAEHLYRRIIGEITTSRQPTDVYIEGDTIRIRYFSGIEEIVWRIIKTSPLVTFSSIDLKIK